MSLRIGIDEVGRGPIAGPVGIGVFAVSQSMYSKLLRKGFFRGIKDSKRLTPAKRYEWREKILALKSKEIFYQVTLISAKQVDSKGIASCIRLGIENGLKKVKAEDGDTVLLDGGIKAPLSFRKQKTIIKGDEKEPVIALASIFAKIARDEYMERVAKKYPGYYFETHKGYGTKKHYSAIHLVGLSIEHRRSFLGKFLR